MIAFLDANALIYLLEAKPRFAAPVHAALTELGQAHAALEIALSRLSWMECRVGPLRTGDADTLALYDAFFAQPELRWVELSREVVASATALRAQHGLRTPDALQAACCLALGPAHTLLTGDAAFKRVADLNVRVLTEQE
ncbi:MAG: PIN domain-containing protein [Pseudomonadota bacterium]|nr:PIN domain-containing protein [Pseudomonadota bacterium]